MGSGCSPSLIDEKKFSKIQTLKQSVYIEVTNTLSLGSVSGIQRVTREVLRTILSADSAFNFTPIVYCRYCKYWRRLSEREMQRLLSENVTPFRRQSKFRRTVNSLKLILSAGFYRSIFAKVNDYYKLLKHPPCDSKLSLREFEPGSIFLDMESGWFSEINRHVFLPALKKNNISSMVVQYDLLPIIHPLYFPVDTRQRFSEYFAAHLENESVFICISENTERDLKRHVAEKHGDRRITTERIVLGADFAKTSPISERRPQVLPEGRYILSVGTIEPRKNYDFLLSVYDRIIDRFPDVTLAIVGKEGWQSSGFIRRLQSHRLFHRKLFWLEGVDDHTLSSLYRNASLGIVPSLYEGYGLPVAESLRNGCVTLSSNGGSLPEVGGDYVDYFDPWNEEELVRLITEYLSDEEKYLTQKKRISTYLPPTWRQTGMQLLAILEKHSILPS